MCYTNYNNKNTDTVNNVQLWLNKIINNVLNIYKKKSDNKAKYKIISENIEQNFDIDLIIDTLLLNFSKPKSKNRLILKSLIVKDIVFDIMGWLLDYNNDIKFTLEKPRIQYQTINTLSQKKIYNIKMKHGKNLISSFINSIFTIKSNGISFKITNFKLVLFAFIKINQIKIKIRYKK